MEPKHPPAIIAKGALERALWGRRMFGFVPLAAALLFAFHRDERFLTAKELSELSDVSEDTARRHLEKLVEIGRVAQRTEARSRTYRVTDEMARKLLEALVTVPKQV